MSLKNDFMWVVAAQIIGLLSGLFGLKVLTNLMDTGQFGIYQLGWSVALIFTTGLFSPFGHAIIRLYPNFAALFLARDFTYKNVKNLSLLVLVIFIIGLAISFALSAFAQVNLLFCIATLFAVLGLGVSLFLQHFQTSQRQRKTFAISQFFVSFGRPISAAFAILFFSFSSDQASMALLASGVYLLLFGFVQFWFVKRGLLKSEYENQQSEKPDALEIESGKEQIANNSSILAVAIPMAIIGCLTVFSVYIDRWIMSQMLDVAAVGIYAAMFQISIAPLTFMQGTANRFALPLIFKNAISSNSKSERMAAMKNAKKLVWFWGAGITLVVLTAFVAHQLIVQLLTTPAIAQYSDLLPILLLGMALEKTAQVITIKGNTTMQIKRYVPARLLHIIVLLPLGVWLTSLYGIYGFAFAHVVAGLAILIATIWVNFKLIKHTI
ncbi:MAG: lipopolysaccharide biosynthesis protein [Nitratireductor sp.]